MMSHTPFSRVLIALGLTLIGVSAAQPQAINVNLPTSANFMDEDGKTFKLTVSPNSGELRIDAKTSHCLSDSIETPGQAWRANISTGGVTLLAAQKTTIMPWVRGQQLGLGTIRPLTRRVNILVIDKFESTGFPLKEGGPLLKLSLNHGNLVIAHLNGVLKTVNGGSFKVFHIDIDRARAVSGNEQVTTKAFLTYLKREMQSSLKEINTKSPLVINMSIAILPCELQKRYADFRDAAAVLKPPKRLRFRQFLDEVARLNHHQGDTESYIESIIVPISFQDPLQDWLNEQKLAWEEKKVPFVAVASSGNYGLPFQTMPAAWPQVLGVAASSVTASGVKTDWSDAGDVLEIGEWYTFGTAIPQSSFKNILSAIEVSASGSTTTHGVQSNVFAYLGTSFAAPTVTAALAVALGKANSNCFDVSQGKFIFMPFLQKKISGTVQPVDFLTSFQQCMRP